jgi:hypothetical protein
MDNNDGLFFLSWLGFMMIGVPLMLLTGVIMARQRLAVERGLRPLFQQTSGGQVGWISYRGPFIRLTLYEEFLVIRCWQAIVLRYDQIERVEVTKWLGLITEGVRIVHHGTAPGRIRLGSGDPIRIKMLIEARLPVKPPAYLDPNYRLS